MRGARAKARLAGWIAFAAPLLLYAWTARRHVGFWDVGEMDTVPWILGIPHPTGFPLYVLIGWSFAHLVSIGSVALRMSLLSAAGMSVAAWLLARIVTDRTGMPWIGTICALFFASGAIAWRDATRAEVHTLVACGVATAFFFGLRWYRTGAPAALLAAATAWGAAAAVHPVALLMLPGVLVVVVARLHRTPSRVLAAAIALFAAAAFVPYLYLPLRSAYVVAHGLDPAQSLGLPLGSAFWNYDDPRTLGGLARLLSGSGFDVSDGLHAFFDPGTFARVAALAWPRFVQQLGLAGIAAAAAGLLLALRRDATETVALALCSLPCIVFAMSYGSEADPARYLLTAFIVATIFAGDALAALARTMHEHGKAARTALVLVAAVVLLLPAAAQRDLLAQPNDASADATIASVVARTAPNALLLAPWYYATPLAYAAYVRRDAGDRTVLAVWLGDVAEAVTRWLAMRPVYVVGQVVGNPPPGYRLVSIPGSPALFRIVPVRNVR